jgi:hypothetical protein
MRSDLAKEIGCSNSRVRGRAALSLFVLTIIAPLLSGCPGVQVDGSSAAGSALLSWNAPSLDTDGSPVTGLAGFHVYAGTDAANLSLRGGVSDAETTTFEVSGLGPGTYYFAVTAYNQYGEESAKSNIGSKTF